MRLAGAVTARSPTEALHDAARSLIRHRSGPVRRGRAGHRSGEEGKGRRRQDRLRQVRTQSGRPDEVRHDRDRQGGRQGRCLLLRRRNEQDVSAQQILQRHRGRQGDDHEDGREGRQEVRDDHEDRREEVTVSDDMRIARRHPIRVASFFCGRPSSALRRLALLTDRAALADLFDVLRRRRHLARGVAHVDGHLAHVLRHL